MTNTDICKAARVLAACPTMLRSCCWHGSITSKRLPWRTALADMDPLSDAEQRTALAALAERIFSVAGAAGQARAAGPAPFASLCRADVATLRSLLAAERTQTVALVLSYLPAELAAELLHTYPASVQSAVIDSISAMYEVDREVLEDVEAVLNDALSRTASRHITMIDGPAAAAGILALLDQEAERNPSSIQSRGNPQPATDATLPAAPHHAPQSGVR